jgi:hypothetical protein
MELVRQVEDVARDTAGVGQVIRADEEDAHELVRDLHAGASGFRHLGPHSPKLPHFAGRSEHEQPELTALRHLNAGSVKAFASC